MKKYIKVLKDAIISVYINNKLVIIKAYDSIIIDDGIAYYNNQRIDNNLSINMIYIPFIREIYGRKHITYILLNDYDVSINNGYIIYNEQEYRNLKLNKLLNENLY